MIKDKKLLNAKRFDLRSHIKWTAMYDKVKQFYDSNIKIPPDKNTLQNWVYNQTRWMKQKLTGNEPLAQRTKERIRLLGLIGIEPELEETENWQRKSVNVDNDERNFLLKNRSIKKIDNLIEHLRIVHNESYIKVLMVRANEKEKRINEEKRQIQETKYIYETLEPESSLGFLNNTEKSSKELIKELDSQIQIMKERFKEGMDDISEEDTFRSSSEDKPF